MKRIPEPADQTYDERIGPRNSCARLPATCMKDALRQIPAQQPDHRPQQETPSVMDIWEIVVVEYHAFMYVCRCVMGLEHRLLPFGFLSQYSAAKLVNE